MSRETESCIARMTSPEFKEAVAGKGLVILPVASVEQTGSHCPLGTDLIVASRVGAALAAKVGCLAAPAIPYGDTQELDFWPGTVDIPPEVLGPYAEAAARSFLKSGALGLAFLCTHSLNMKSIDLACRRLYRDGLRACAIDWWKAAGQAAKGETSSEEPFGHGGEVITSVMMAVAPDLVRLEAARDEASLPGLAYALGHMPGAPFVAYGDFRQYCRSGAWGEVSRSASAEKGKRWLERGILDCASFLKEWMDLGARSDAPA